MDEAAKRFARKVLLIHLALLAAVLVVVWFASWELHTRARAQVIQQAQQREELLALQTANGVQSYYTSILSNLDLVTRTEGEPAAEAVRAATDFQTRSRLVTLILWQQLKDRAVRFFGVDQQTMKVVHNFGDVPLESDQDIVAHNLTWLRTLTGPTISEPQKLAGEDVVLLAAPIARNARLLVAVVPIKDLDRRFFDSADRFAGLSVGLIDGRGHVVAASDQTFDALADAPDSSMWGQFVRTEISDPHSGTHMINPPGGGVATIPPSLVSAQPITLPGVHWSVVVRSSLSDLDAILNQLFGRAVIWGIFLIASVVAILGSSATLLIRGRLKMERMQHEMLTRELAQARQIQLAWLPDPAKNDGPFRVAAVNQPASHISGDFYNWFDLPDGRHAIVIGDVTGHGMAAAFLMATTQLLVRAALTRTCDAGKSLEMVNRELCVQAFQGQFVTLLILILDARIRRIDIATAGHPAPMIWNGHGFVPMKVDAQLLLGVEEEAMYPTQSFAIPAGAALVLYTDGVIEAHAPSGQQFTTEGLQRALAGAQPDPHGIVTCVIDAVREFSAGRDLSDDLTLVAVAMDDVDATRDRVGFAASEGI
jgi:serine phosphatase RsbU (regulator of sigma subunit)